MSTKQNDQFYLPIRQNQYLTVPFTHIFTSIKSHTENCDIDYYMESTGVITARYGIIMCMHNQFNRKTKHAVSKDDPSFVDPRRSKSDCLYTRSLFCFSLAYNWSKTGSSRIQRIQMETGWENRATNHWFCVRLPRLAH